MSVIDGLHREDAFERYLSRSIAGLEGENGWRVSPDDTGFDPQTALYMPDFIEFQERVARPHRRTHRNEGRTGPRGAGRP